MPRTAICLHVPNNSHKICFERVLWIILDHGRICYIFVLFPDILSGGVSEVRLAVQLRLTFKETFPAITVCIV